MIEEQEEAPQEEELVSTDWRAVPTVVVDAAIGTVTIGGTYRVTLAEMALNPEPGAKTPKVRPVISISLTPVSAAHLVEYLTKMILPAGAGEESSDVQ